MKSNKTPIELQIASSLNVKIGVTRNDDAHNENSSKRKEPDTSSLEEVQSSAVDIGTSSKSDEKISAISIIAPGATSKSASKLSPYETRMKDLKEACPAEHILYPMCDIFTRIPSLSDPLDPENNERDHPSDWSSEKQKRALSTLTQEQCNLHLHYIILPITACQLRDRYHNALLRADTRNNDNDGFIMLNTYSSWCMYPIIAKQINIAVRTINIATKAVQSQAGAVIPDIASNALHLAIAAILACDECDHWRIDTESPEECEKVAKKVSKLAKDLLWFEDSELGFVDNWSRRALLVWLEGMDTEWKEIEWMESGISFATKKNGWGMGRGCAPANPAKKARVDYSAAVSDTTATGTITTAGIDAAVGTTTGAVGATMPRTFNLAYLGGIQDKLHLCIKTQLQLKISSLATPTKTTMVVVTGASDMKKINQVCAYVTGHTEAFEYRPNQGKILKGSRIEASTLGGGVLWLAEKTVCKQAEIAGVSHVVDKTLKIVQIFQGLNCYSSSPTNLGITFDLELAQIIATAPNSVVWVAPTGERYAIEVQVILSNKCCSSLALPRIVTYDDEYKSQARTGFKLPVHKSNRLMRGNRQVGKYIGMRFMTKFQINQTNANVAAKALWLENRYSLNDENMSMAGVPEPW